MSKALWETSCCIKSKIRKYYLSCHVLRQTKKEKLFINQRNETTPARMAKGFAWKRNIKPCCTQDLLTNSPYCLPYNFYGVRSENFILDHQAILKFIFFFIPVAFLPGIVLILLQEILPWSLVGIKGLRNILNAKTLISNNLKCKIPLKLPTRGPTYSHFNHKLNFCHHV